MNHAVSFSVPETFTITRHGATITGRVIERNRRRLAVHLVAPYGLLHVSKHVHPSIGGALGFTGSAGDVFKVELLQFLHRRAQLLEQALPTLVRAYRLHGLERAVLASLQPLIGRYAPFEQHGFLLATHALERQPVLLPALPEPTGYNQQLTWPDVQVLLYRDLLESH